MINVREEISLKTLSKIRLPNLTVVGRHWKGVPHIQAVEALADAVGERGWTIKKSFFALSNDKMDMAASFDIDCSTGSEKIKFTEGWVLCLGIFNSNAQRKRMKLYIGIGKPTAEIRLVTAEFERRHTKTLDLKNFLTTNLNSFIAGGLCEAFLLQYKFKDKQLTDIEWKEIFLKAGEKEIGPWSRVGKVYEIWKWGTTNKTAWNLYVLFSCRVIRKSPPLVQMDKMEAFRRILKQTISHHKPRS